MACVGFIEFYCLSVIWHPAELWVVEPEPEIFYINYKGDIY